MKLKVNDFLDAVQKQKDDRKQKTTTLQMHQEGLSAQDRTQDAVYSAIELLARFLADHEPKVTVKNQIEIPKSISVPQIDDVAKSLADLLVATKQNKYDDKAIAAKLNKVSKELQSLPRDIKFPDIPKPLDTVAVSNQIDYTNKFDELANTFSSIKVEAPAVKVAAPKVTVDNTEVAKVVNELKDVIISAISGIEMPEYPSLDQKPVIEALRALQKEIHDRPVVKPPSVVTATNADGNPIGNSLGLPEHNNGTVAYPTSTREVFTFKQDATTVATVTINYTDSTKSAMSSWSIA